VRGNLEYEFCPWDNEPEDLIVPRFELAWMRPLVPDLRSLTVRYITFIVVTREVLNDGESWWKVELKDGCGPCLPQELAAEFKGVEVRFECVVKDDVDFYFVEP
jgi:hypothetical protein